MLFKLISNFKKLPVRVGLGGDGGSLTCSNFRVCTVRCQGKYSKMSSYLGLFIKMEHSARAIALDVLLGKAPTV